MNYTLANEKRGFIYGYWFEKVALDGIIKITIRIKLFVTKKTLINIKYTFLKWNKKSHFYEHF